MKGWSPTTLPDVSEFDSTFYCYFFLRNSEAECVPKISGNLTGWQPFKSCIYHGHGFSICATKIPKDFCRLSLAPDVAPNLLMTSKALSRFSNVPSRNNKVSSANTWLVIVELSRSWRPCARLSGCYNIWPKTSTVRRNRWGASEHPCLTSLWGLKVLDCSPLTITEAKAFKFNDITCLILALLNPILSIICCRNVQFTFS